MEVPPLLIVDEMHPLGVTDVNYIPDRQAHSQIIAKAVEDYNELKVVFERIETEINREISEARYELQAALDTILATIEMGDLTLADY